MKRTVCALYILYAVISCRSVSAAQGWTVNTMAYDSHSAPDVAVDMNNNPVLIFTLGYPNSHLAIAKQTQAGIETERLPDAPAASWPKIGVTSNDELAAVFAERSSVWYAAKGSWFDWTYSQAEGINTGYCDFALTDDDIPHLAYINSVTHFAEHAFFDVHSRQWYKEALTGFGWLNTPYPCIDVAPDGQLLISIFDIGQSKTFCAVYSDGNWKYLPPIDSASYSDCSFTADSLPALAYIKGVRLYYAVYINNIISWQETEIAPAISQFKVSLAHSSTGTPAIAYNYNGIMLATVTIAGWTTTAIDNGIYPDLIFDRNDKPLITYNSTDDCTGTPVIKLAGTDIEPFNIADLNNDKVVNFSDFAILAGNWQKTAASPSVLPSDLNGNNIVELEDLQQLMCNWLWEADLL